MVVSRFLDTFTQRPAALNKRRHRRFRAISLLITMPLVLVASFVAGSGIAAAQEAKQPEEVEKTASVQKPSADIETDSVEQLNLAKRKRAFAGVAAIGGIAILGIVTIAMTMVWAKRLRRLARDPGPVQTTVGNDFWFLKPPKPTVSESNLTDSHRPPQLPPPPDTASETDH